MKEFPQTAKFKYSWRNYQQRVLDELQGHLTDRHLHVVAPPGSGKTVLGLEVALRLNKPTLILAPTLAIRNQWVQRFCELFLDTTLTPDWISRDIRNPRFLTVATYQGLHAACNNLRFDEVETEEEDEYFEGETPTRGNPNLDQIADSLKRQKIQTIVVDEAHHLKNEWWQTLTWIKERLDPVIVGLTATPPYDVKATEWDRYCELNGPVDAEISVPELVVAEDLCPHQDYVRFSHPTENESQSIIEFRQKIQQIFLEIKQDETLMTAIESHPICQDPTSQLEWIYNNVSFYSACIIFLNEAGRKIPETHLEVIGCKGNEIPRLNYEWMTTFLEYYLYSRDDHFTKFETHRGLLEGRLRRHGATERRQVNFLQNSRMNGFLTSSISKLDGVKAIVDLEYSNLGRDLRLVILTDFIRKEFLVSTAENESTLNKIGAIPIFEKLRRENSADKKIAVLTGSIVIIPVCAFSAFEKGASRYGIREVVTTPVPFDESYLLVTQTEQLRHEIVQIVTEIFQQGEIEVLIGTKALLGEGWDAPAINSLILASFVGSFVLSNQMRGRAIRTQQGNADKTSNIWHLVCIDPTSPTGGADFDLLKRRFRSFVGVSSGDEPVIENGVARLNFPANIRGLDAVDRENAEISVRAADRKSLKLRWETALETGVNLVEEIKLPFPEEREFKPLKSMYLKRTIAYLLATLVSGVVSFAITGLEGLSKAARKIRTMDDLYLYIAAFGAIGILVFGGLSYKTARLYFTYRDISKDIRNIAEALLVSLIRSGVVKTESSRLRVEASVDDSGAVACHLKGGTTFEKSVFISALMEIVGPVNNPRYVIIRKHRLLHFKNQIDFHPVPEILGRNKNLAEILSDQWSRFVGSCDLVFTRTVDGRKLLLKARGRSLAAQFESTAEHLNKWR